MSSVPHCNYLSRQKTGHQTNALSQLITLTLDATMTLIQSSSQRCFLQGRVIPRPDCLWKRVELTQPRTIILRVSVDMSRICRAFRLQFAPYFACPSTEVGIIIAHCLRPSRNKSAAPSSNQASSGQTN